jgi:hypothetical protein
MSKAGGLMQVDERTAVSLPEALLITGICFGWAIVGSTFSVLSGFRGHEFSDARFVGIIASELFFGGLALFVLHRRGYEIATLYPTPSVSGAVFGTGLYLAAAFVSGVLAASMASVVSWNPLDNLLKGPHPSLAVNVALAVVNGSYEEIFLLGFLLRGLRRYGASVALGSSLLVRVLYHTYQGPVGAISILGYGLVVSVFYLKSSLLFPAVFAHILGDIIPFAFMGAAKG